MTICAVSKLEITTPRADGLATRTARRRRRFPTPVVVGLARNELGLGRASVVGVGGAKGFRGFAALAVAQRREVVVLASPDAHRASISAVTRAPGLLAGSPRLGRI